MERKGVSGQHSCAKEEGRIISVPEGKILSTLTVKLKIEVGITIQDCRESSGSGCTEGCQILLLQEKMNSVND